MRLSSRFSRSRISQTSRLNLRDLRGAVSGGVIDGGPTGAVSYGALTLAGVAVQALPSGNPTVVNDGGTNLTHSGTNLVVGAGGGITTGTITFSDASTLEITAIAGAFTANCSQSEIRAAALAAASLASGAYRVLVRAGEVVGSKLDLSGIVMAGTLTVASAVAGWGAQFNGGTTLDDSTGVILENTSQRRDKPAAGSYTDNHVISMNNAVRCTIRNNLTRSNDMVGQDYVVTGHLGFDHIGAAGGTSMTDCVIEDNLMQNGSKPFYCTDNDNNAYRNNRMLDFYGNFGELHGDYYYEYNVGNGLWAHGGGTAFAGPNNDYTPGTGYPYDVNDPHSSCLGTGGGCNWQYVRFNILNCNPTRRLLLNGDYIGLASGPKWNDPTGGNSILVATYNGVVCMFNIFGVTDNVGLGLGYLTNSVIAHNTLYFDMDCGLTTQPGVNYSQIGPNVAIHHNIATSFTTSTTFNSMGLHYTLFEQSHDNLVFRPDGMNPASPTLASHVMSFDTQFVGPTFTGLHADQLVAALTPKPGSRALAGAVQCGAVTSYYNWNTQTLGTLPTWTKPVSSVVTGAETPRAVFSGTGFLRSSPAPAMTNADELTILIGLQVDASADNGAEAICLSSESNFYIRKLDQSVGSQKARWEVFLKNADNSGYSFVMQSSQDLRSDDGFQVFGFSIRHSTMDLRVLTGSVVDPMPQVTTWTGLPHRLGGANLDLMPFEGILEFFYMTDEFVDLYDPVALSRVVAQDGRRPAGGYGASGSLVSGTQPRALVDHTAAEINTGGVQKGSAPQTFSMSGGTVSAFITDETPAGVSTFANAAIGQTQFSGSFDLVEDNVDVWLVTQRTSIAAPSSTQVRAGQDGSGAALPAAQVFYFDNIDTGTQAYSGTGLEPGVQYRTYAVTRDLAGNISDVIVASTAFTTESATFGETWAKFSDAKDVSIRRTGDLVGAGVVSQAVGMITYRPNSFDMSADARLLRSDTSTAFFANVLKFGTPVGNVMAWEAEHTGNARTFYRYTTSAAAVDTEYALLWSWDSTLGGTLAVINLGTGAALGLVNAANSFPNNLTLAAQNGLNIGATNAARANAISGALGRVMLITGAYYDFTSPAGRDHFIAGDGALRDPDLAVAAVATDFPSSNAIVYMRGADFVTANNRGTGGAFALNGTGSITVV